MDFFELLRSVHAALLTFSPLTRSVMTLCSLLALSSLWYFCCFVPLSGAIVSYATQIDQLKKQKCILEKRGAGTDLLAQQVAELERFTHEKKKKLPRGVSAQRKKVFALLKKHQIILKEDIPGAKEAYNGLSIISFTYMLSGLYEHFINFFAALEKSEPAPVCKRLELTKSGLGINGVLTLLFLVKGSA